jgi:hypothetical protein
MHCFSIPWQSNTFELEYSALYSLIFFAASSSFHNHHHHLSQAALAALEAKHPVLMLVLTPPAAAADAPNAGGRQKLVQLAQQQYGALARRYQVSLHVHVSCHKIVLNKSLLSLASCRVFSKYAPACFHFFYVNIGLIMSSPLRDTQGVVPWFTSSDPALFERFNHGKSAEAVVVCWLLGFLSEIYCI